MTMIETRYGKYVMKQTPEERKSKLQLAHLKGEAPTKLIARLRGENAEGGTQLSFGLGCVYEPFLLRPDAHKHDFEQFLCFFGGDPMNPEDFGGEVELSLGEEGEKHIITSNTIVYLPGGLIHGPLNFKKIDRPIMYMDIFLSPAYSSKKADAE
jgi:hypothetical protein